MLKFTVTYIARTKTANANNEMPLSELFEAERTFEMFLTMTNTVQYADRSGISLLFGEVPAQLPHLLT